MKSPLVVAALVIPLLLTALALGLWAATDYHAYTKFTVVERVPVAQDDIFANTGLFDSDDGVEAMETVTRESFHFGLLPTPQSLLDRHMISVFTFTVPPWTLALGFLGLVAWRRRRSAIISGA